MIEVEFNHTSEIYYWDPTKEEFNHHLQDVYRILVKDKMFDYLIRHKLVLPLGNTKSVHLFGDQARFVIGNMPERIINESEINS